jgi:hypothetical protein
MTSKLSVSLFALLALGACGDGDDAPAASPTPPPATTAQALSPVSGDTAAYTDTRLKLTFDTAPVLAGEGALRVYKSDGTLVDTIGFGQDQVLGGGETQTALGNYNTEIDKIGNNVANLTQWRFTYYRPVTISGNVATIKLHDGVLAPATSYYVTIDRSAFNGAFGGSTTFPGVNGSSAWTFRTKAAPTSATSITVDDDGAADFRSLQGALNYVMATGCNACANAAATKTITVRNGTYDEQLFLRNTSNVTIQGESRTGTIVRNENWEAFNPGTGGSRTAANTTFSNIGGAATLGTRRTLGGGRAVLLIEGGDQIRLTNFTLQNTHVKSATQNSQAETVYFNSANLNGSRFVGSNMNFVSTQDTLQMKGWVWIYNSFVAGDVDFIWGYPYAMLIEQSELQTVVDPTAPTSGGYVFQARSAKGYPGFVVLGGSLTAAAGVPAGSTYLARSGGVTQAQGYCQTAAVLGGASAGNAQLYCDSVAYIGVTMGAHVAPAGWWINPVPNLMPSATEGWRESGSLAPNGVALNVAARERTYATTTANLTGLNTRTKVFAQWNGGVGWAPAP